MQNNEWRSPDEINGIVEYQYPRSERVRVTDSYAERLRDLYHDFIGELAGIPDDELDHMRWVAVDACQEFGSMPDPSDTRLGGFRWYAATMMSAACAYEQQRRRKLKREDDNA